MARHSSLSLCVILNATKMTFYRAMLIAHRACKLRMNEKTLDAIRKAGKQMSIA